MESDRRFAHIGKDPRFRRMGKKQRKVRIDKRFQSMFEDRKFKLKYTVDKRGRPIHTTTNENLRKFYDLSDSESSDDEKLSSEKKIGKGNDQESMSEKTVTVNKQSKKIKKEKTARKKSKDKYNEANSESEDGRSETNEKEQDGEMEGSAPSDGSADSLSDGDETKLLGEESDDETSESEADDNGKVDLARGEGNISSSDEEDEEFEFDEEKFDHKWAEMDKDAPEASEITSRLAVCNMDWDRIKVEDLLILFNSFKPAGGIIKKISVYLSEFGKERMAEEDMKGPKELVEQNDQETTDESDGTSYHMEKLRQYQLNRLKYYYAVMECDSSQTANHIYEQCDGTEYESSSTRIDLRFIPDGMEFDEEPKWQVTDMPDTVTYRPTLFNCKALNQSQVELTWDETDKKRTEVLMRKFNKDDLEKMDMKDYLASSSSDDEDPYAGIEVADFLKTAVEDDEKKITEEKEEKYKDLLSIVKDGKDIVEGDDMEMEISWEPGLKEATENLVEVKKKKKNKQSPWEEYLEKKKQKKGKKKHQNSEEPQEYEDGGNNTSEDELPAGVDLNDPYFKEEMDRMNEEEGRQETSNKEKKKKKRKKHKHLQDVENNTEDEQEQAALSLLTMDQDDDKQHFNLKRIQENEKLECKKKKRRRNKKKLLEHMVTQDTFQINTDDPRFSSIYENPLYNIDPSAPEYKATKSMEILAGEKVKRRRENDRPGKRKVLDMDSASKAAKASTDIKIPSLNSDASLASLVKSVKAKTKTIQSKKVKLK